MIDTLKLNLVDFDIKKSCPLTIQPATLDYSTGKLIGESDLFVDNTGKIIKGIKAYYNHEKFNLTIQPTFESEIDDETNKSRLKVKRFSRLHNEQNDNLFAYDSDEDVKGVFIQTSIPRIMNDTNVKSLSIEDEKKALQHLEKLLKTNGIRTNIFNSNLSRVDTFTNVKTDFNFQSYTNLFSLMECSRMKAVDYAGETFRWQNSNRQLTIYDKVLDMKRKYPDLKIRHSNIMRFENRLLKKRSIATKLKIEKLSDIYKNYDELKYFHTNEIEKNIFRYSLDEINNLTVTNLTESFLKAKKVYGKRWFNKYCQNFGVWILSKVNSKDDIKNALIEIEGNYDVKVRMKVSRIIKMVNDSKIFFNLVFNDSLQEKSNADLYNELKTKFYKEVA